MPAHLAFVLATIATALSAGVYAAYAVAVMPGLRSTDDPTFVAAFGAMDRAIVTPVFLVGVFVGSPALILVTGLLGGFDRPWLGWAALVLTVLAVVLTVAVNVPLNDALKAATETPGFDPTQVRAAFHEARWSTANLVRLALEVGALALLVSAVAS